jgi:hypothetical protein
MHGLDPRICRSGKDGRVKPGHDEKDFAGLTKKKDDDGPL